MSAIQFAVFAVTNTAPLSLHPTPPCAGLTTPRTTVPACSGPACTGSHLQHLQLDLCAAVHQVAKHTHGLIVHTRVLRAQHLCMKNGMCHNRTREVSDGNNMSTTVQRA